MVEALKQVQYEPLDTARQVVIIYAGTNGYLDDLAVSAVRKFEPHLYKFIEKNYPGIRQEIELKDDLGADLRSKLDKLIADAKKEFLEVNPK
jgi:F-type H+-transporting ATPase subunit alpha